MPESANKPRKRNAAATREAILRSAHECFVRSGYDGVGVREIAAGAGVTAMLVNRYFGSKESLFAEVIARDLDAPTILTPETLASPTLARDMARLIVAVTDSQARTLDGFQMMFRSAGSTRAAELAKEQIERFHHQRLAGVLSGDKAAERAAIILSLVAGVQILRQMIGLDALSKADPDVLAQLIEPLIAALIALPKA
ncbi:MAG: TetR family transcriptional regulator [Methylobacterium sp. SCN 67-24]|nr:MAG: TetR family transcriptional regulator [Methylobacterium sp. SCN 67-24]